MTELREKVATAIRDEIERQTDGRWPMDLGDGRWLVDAELSPDAITAAILALPELAALKLTIVKPLKLGPSISTDKRDPV